MSDANEPKVTVRVEDAHVRYRLTSGAAPRLRALLAGRSAPPVKEVHAVRGVSLTARAGDAIGLIGRNGSGKSTLLRAIAGLLPTASGSVAVAGIPRLLGVSAALRAELTGRENIILGGTALGIRRTDLDELVPEIVDFSGLDEFIDLPLKTYSSGMKARLQFAVATAVRPEILLIDEALAVGDEEFKERSEARIDELLAHAGTIFLVSHGLSNIRETCNRALWLDEGRVQASGEVGHVIKEYKAFVRARKDRRAAGGDAA